MIHCMSISVSTLVKPSKLLRLMVGTMGLLTICFSILIGMGAVACFSFFSRMVIVGASIVVIGCCFFYFFQYDKTYRIDIANSGQIRLTAYTSFHNDNENNGEIVFMMNGSILWSGLLLLRLKSDRGREHILRVLPDSVSSESFRMLLVACRWIAAHRHDSI